MPGTALRKHADCSLHLDRAAAAAHAAAAAGRVERPESGYLTGSSSTIWRVVNATRAAFGLSDADCRRLAVDNPLRLISVSAHLGILPRHADGAYLSVED